MTEVIPRLYIGNWRDAEQHINSMYVVTVAHDSPIIGNVKFNLIDGPGNDIKVLMEAVTHAYDAYHRGEKVLIHCHGGRSRSGTVLVAVLAKITGRNLCECYDFVLSKHHETRIHPYLAIMLMEVLNDK